MAEGEKKEVTELMDDIEDKNMTQMGVFSWRPSFLKIFNRPNVFTTVHAFNSFFLVFSITIFGTVLPTLESVFNLNGKQAGLILVINDISGMIAALFLANFCSARKVRWMGIGAVTAAIASILPVLATAFAEYPKPELKTNENIAYATCSSEIESDNDESYAALADRNHRLYWLFIAGSVLQGIGATPPGIAGSTYLDEIYKQRQFGIAISLIYIVSILGYPASLLLGGYFLSMYVTLDPPKGMTMHNSRGWVGNWWLGMLIPGLVLLLGSSMISLFPRHMTSAKAVLEDKIKRGVTTAGEKQNELGRSMKDMIKEMIPTFMRMLKNKALIFLVIGDICLYLDYSVVPFLPKIFSMLYRLDVSYTTKLLGVVNIGGFLLGLVPGAIFIRRKHWHAKKLMLVYFFLSIISTPLIIGAFLARCSPNQHAGVDLPYPTGNELSQANVSHACNTECSCTTDVYQPVCDDDVTFFSPCHAGCKAVEPIEDSSQVKIYRQCSCTKTTTALPGKCKKHCADRMWLSMTLWLAGLIVNFTGFPAHAIVSQRIVSESDRTATQGLISGATRMFGKLPAPLIFGSLFDITCTVWRQSDSGKQGFCWIYDVERFLMLFILVSLAVKVVKCISYGFCWWTFPVEDNVKANCESKDKEFDAIEANST